MTNRVVYISGTPGTGKTTITSKLRENFDNIFCISVNDFAISNNLILGEDPDKGYKIIDVERLNDELNHFIDDELESYNLIVVEGHLSHLCDGCDKCIVLRLNPRVLKERLEDRDYSDEKILENIEAEVLDVCSVEAYEKHKDNVCEIDTSSKSVDDVLKLVIDVILDKRVFPVGNVSFIDYLLE